MDPDLAIYPWILQHPAMKFYGKAHCLHLPAKRRRLLMQSDGIFVPPAKSTTSGRRPGRGDTESIHQTKGVNPLALL